jgi:dTDP-4-dehydrorhamnose reductase
MRILIIGGTGLLGTELTRRSHTAGHHTTATYHTRPDHTTATTWLPLDIRQPHHVTALTTTHQPDIIINTAYRQNDWTTTATGAANIALAAARTGARLIHISSDAVFSGTTTHYDETATPDPTTPYGAANAAAETAVHAITPTAITARTSLLIARRDHLDPTRLTPGRRADTGLPGPLDIRLRCTTTQQRLQTRLRGAREFL